MFRPIEYDSVDNFPCLAKFALSATVLASYAEKTVFLFCYLCTLNPILGPILTHQGYILTC